MRERERESIGLVSRYKPRRYLRGIKYPLTELTVIQDIKHPHQNTDASWGEKHRTLSRH